jgi:large subunit ribosomal protein L3
MAAGLIGKKVGMTRVFTAEGNQVPVSVVAVGPCIVIGKRTKDVDGYTAVRVGFGFRKDKHTNKPQAGEAKKSGQKAPVKIQEFRLTEAELAGFEVGQELKADFFTKGQKVDVVGTSRGRGFAGVFKRHHMAGFVEGHGSHEYFRHGGAIGQRKTPGRVFKNKRMPGHMGVERKTIQNLKVVDVDVENNIVLIHGAIPGHPEGLITIKPTVKVKAQKKAK